MSSVPNPTIDFEQLEQWLAQGASGSGDIAKLQQMIVQLQAQILSLQAAQTDLNAQLADLEKIADPSKAQKDEMASLKSQISGNQSKLNQFNSEMNMDKTLLTNSESDFKSFISESKTMSNSNRTLNKELKHAINSLNTIQSKLTAAQQAEQQAEQNAEIASKAITDYAQLQVQYGSDALDQLSRIQNDQQRIDEDKAKATELQDTMIEDSIVAAGLLVGAWFTFGASLAGTAYYTYEAVEAGIGMQKAKDDEASASSDLDQAKAALQQDLTNLTASNVGELQTMIDELFGAIDKILKTFGTGQGSVEDATKALAEVLSFLQMITTKVHQLKEQDQVWTNRANAESFQVAAHKSQVNFEAMAALQQYAEFMKTVMTGVEVLADVASVAGAIASGGTLAPIIATLMIALSVSGAFTKATEALAHAISKTDAVWAQVVAEVIVTVVCVILTCSLNAAVEEVLAATGRSIAQKVALFLKTLIKTLLSPKTLKVFLTGRGAGMAAMYFGSTNGIADLAEWITAASMQKGNESKKELEKDKTFQILQMVMGIIQAIIVAVAGYATLSSGGGQQLFKTPEWITALAQKFQMLGGALTVLGLSSEAVNDGSQAGLTLQSGQAEADSIAYKAVHEMVKAFEGKELEAFAALIQQEVQSLLITLRKMGESELEAARLLLETAV